MGLANAATTDELIATFAMMYDSDLVPSQEFPSMLARLARNTAGGRDMAWAFFRDSWPTLIEPRYGDGGFGLDRILTAVISVFDSMEDYEVMKHWFDINQVTHGLGSIARALETVEVNAQWRVQQLPIIEVSLPTHERR